MSERKGQHLYNRIRENFTKEQFINQDAVVARILWNMSDKEFDEIMNELDKHRKLKVVIGVN